MKHLFFSRILAICFLFLSPIFCLAQSWGSGFRLTESYGFWGFLIFIVIVGLVAYSKLKDKDS